MFVLSHVYFTIFKFIRTETYKDCHIDIKIYSNLYTIQILHELSFIESCADSSGGGVKTWPGGVTRVKAELHTGVVDELELGVPESRYTKLNRPVMNSMHFLNVPSLSFENALPIDQNVCH